MKNLFLFSFFLALSLNKISGQNNWVNTSPIKMGIGKEFWTVNDIYNNFRYTQIDDLNNSGPLDVSSNNSFSYSRFPLVFENIGKNIHVSGSTTGAVDLLARAISGFPKVGDDDTEAITLDLIPFQFAGGGWIKDNIGLFGGLNYSYTRISFSDDDVPDELIFGGNKRGVHAVLFYSMSNFLFKSTIMYNWVRNSKRAAKGSAQSVDLEAYYSPVEEGSFGFWVGLRFENMSIEGPNGQGSDSWNHKGIDLNRVYQFPEISGNSMFIRGGIFVLMGGR